jgi:hypothetical protein
MNIISINKPGQHGKKKKKKKKKKNKGRAGWWESGYRGV